ncbi:LrgB family protein [Synechococcus sp. PCC 7336]|uniref:LrgB family protein n=1 Tax=Synechococcus sp. PCC 7336 TaxID=195250 RepID=UPI000363DA40|nr:LrgB family protein [Synechococcus sp. PCC 7336]
MTLAAYNIAFRLYCYAKCNPLLNPVVTAIAISITFLLLTNTSYEVYFEGGQYVHFLLGPATVALAIPLYKQFSKLRQLWLPVSIAIISGVTIGALSSVTIAWLLGASLQTQLSIAPKSVTAPVAMGISEQIGGLPSLTAVLVVMTGILGAVLGTKLLKLMRIKDDSVKGIALGVTAHGMGTARAFQVSSEMGAFSGLAMALSAFSTAILLPWLLSLVGILR